MANNDKPIMSAEEWYARNLTMIMGEYGRILANLIPDMLKAYAKYVLDNQQGKTCEWSKANKIN